MKLFCVSDTHGKPLPPLEGDTAAILVAGDFSDFGRSAGRLFESPSAEMIPIFFVTGNHESRRCRREIDGSYEAFCLDYRATTFCGVGLAGVAGYDLFDSHRAVSLSDFGRQLDAAPGDERPPVSILLTHEPPWPWKHEGRVQGSEGVRELLLRREFALVVTGHYHVENPRMEVDGVIVPTLNPGPGGAYVVMDPKRGFVDWRINRTG